MSGKTSRSTSSPARAETLTGRDYRVRAEHPRRGGPLVIRDRAGVVIAQSGDRCGGVAPDLLASMIQNDYVERVPPTESEA
jgi:hypothetical protein